MTDFSDRSFQLLSELAVNNDRDWFKAYKDEFEQVLLDPFAATLEAISHRLQDRGMNFTGGKKTMFRMNRDVRFSRDKSPYKTNVSGMLTPGGEKRESGGFVYLQLQHNGGFAAFGRYNLRPAALGPIRDKILEKPERFRAILTEVQSTGLDLVRDDSLKSTPRGYSEHSDHPHADELKLKSMMVRIDLTADEFKSGAAVDRVSETALTCQQFIDVVSV
ncbi:MAG: DUF2461 domain-containing protein [Pseudomonadota bacterium]